MSEVPLYLSDRGTPEIARAPVRVPSSSLLLSSLELSDTKVYEPSIRCPRSQPDEQEGQEEPRLKTREDRVLDGPASGGGGMLISGRQSGLQEGRDSCQ